MQFLGAMSNCLREQPLPLDSLDVGGSVFGVVLPEDGEGGEDRSRAFWVVMFDHNPTYNAFSLSSKRKFTSFAYQKPLRG